MQDLPVNFGGYRLMVSEAPSAKLVENKQGELEEKVDRNGVTQFVVSLFAKPVVGPGERSRKGEEINCNLSADPGNGFEPGTYVELVNPQVNVYAIPDSEDPRKISNAGMWFKAAGLKPAGSGGLSSAA